MTKPNQVATRQQSRLDAFKLRAAKDLAKMRARHTAAIDAAKARHAESEHVFWCTIPDELVKPINEMAERLEDEARTAGEDEGE